MIDLEKEREAFIKVYTEIYGEHDQIWQGWKKRSELAQQEINKEREQATEYFIDCEYLKTEISELKAKLAKYESGEFVLVPRVPTKGMIDAVNWSYYPHEVYRAMIEKGEIK